MKTQNLLSRILTVGLMITTIAFIGCKSDIDNEDDTGGGSTGGSTGGGGGSAGSVQFDGSAEYLTLSSDWYNGDVSICLWFRPRVVVPGTGVAGTGHTLLSMSLTDKYWYLSFDDNEMDFFMEDNADNDFTLNAATTIIAGNTYQVCMTIDHAQTAADAVRLYLNGTQIAASGATDNGAVAAAFTTLTVGHEPAPTFQSPDNKTGNFDGEMDNLMIWRTALPANSIAQLYNGGNGIDPTFAFGNYTNPHRLALYHWFPMGENPADRISGSSAVLNDAQGNENLIPFNFESTDFEDGLL